MDIFVIGPTFSDANNEEGLIKVSANDERAESAFFADSVLIGVDQSRHHLIVIRTSRRLL